jgi:hypothetical protein
MFELRYSSGRLHIHLKSDVEPGLGGEAGEESIGTAFHASCCPSRTTRAASRSRLVGTGHVMDAIEMQEGQPRGYLFSVLGDFEADALTLFAQLYERMRAGLAVRHVQHGDLGWQLTKDDALSGRIEADLEDDLRMPILVIDGKEFRWDEVGRMLMSFEGFTVDLRIRDTIDVVGGPLLDEDE